MRSHNSEPPPHLQLLVRLLHIWAQQDLTNKSQKNVRKPQNSGSKSTGSSHEWETWQYPIRNVHRCTQLQEFEASADNRTLIFCPVLWEAQPLWISCLISCILLLYSERSHGVMVSTQDSESCDPSSNLGGALSFSISFGVRVAAEAFMKFSIVAKDVSQLMKNLVSILFYMI